MKYVPGFCCECIVAALDISIRLGQYQLQMFFEWYLVDIRASTQVPFALRHPMHTWNDRVNNDEKKKQEEKKIKIESKWNGMFVFAFQYLLCIDPTQFYSKSN